MAAAADKRWVGLDPETCAELNSWSLSCDGGGGGGEAWTFLHARVHKSETVLLNRSMSI